MKTNQDKPRLSHATKESDTSNRKNFTSNSPSSIGSRKLFNKKSDKIVYTKAFYLRQQNAKRNREDRTRNMSGSPNAHSNSIELSRDDPKVVRKQSDYKNASITAIRSINNKNSKLTLNEFPNDKTESNKNINTTKDTTLRKSTKKFEKHTSLTNLSDHVTLQSNLKNEDSQDNINELKSADIKNKSKNVEVKIEPEGTQKNSISYSSIHNVKSEAAKDPTIVISGSTFNETKKSILEKKQSFKERKVDYYVKGKLAGEVITELKEALDEKAKEMQPILNELRLCKKQNEHYQKLIDNLTYELEGSLAQNKKIFKENQEKSKLLEHFESALKEEKTEHTKIQEECLGFIGVIQNCLQNMPSVPLRKGLNKKIQTSLIDIEQYIRDFDDIVNDHVGEYSQKNTSKLANSRKNTNDSITLKPNTVDGAKKTDVQVKSDLTSDNECKNGDQELDARNFTFKGDNQTFGMFNEDNIDTFRNVNMEHKKSEDERNLQPERETNEKAISEPPSEPQPSTNKNNKIETTNFFTEIENLNPDLEESCEVWDKVEKLEYNYDKNESPTEKNETGYKDPMFDSKSPLRPSLTGINTEIVTSEKDLKNPHLHHKATGIFAEEKNNDAESNTIPDISEIIDIKIKNSNYLKTQNLKQNYDKLATFGFNDQESIMNQLNTQEKNAGDLDSQEDVKEKDNNSSEENYPHEKLL